MYSDKTAFVLYAINAKHIFSNKYKSKEGEPLEIWKYSDEQFLDLYANTVGDYQVRSFDGTLSQFKNLLLFGADEKT
mgnify:CR=1 FL=1